jgi:hypothetical protein
MSAPSPCPDLPRHTWAEELCRPLPMAAVLLLAWNDHVGKGWTFVPEVIRGKLSDVAGLFCFPLLLLALAGLLFRRLAPSRRTALALVCALLTSAGFVSVKTSAAANQLVAQLWGATALDATDLWALPAALLAVLWVGRRAGRASPAAPAWARVAAVALAAFFSAATMAPRIVRQYPEWRIVSNADSALSCANVHAWVSKTGKEGMGVTVRVAPQDHCYVAVQAARLQIGNQEIPAAELPPVEQYVETQPAPVYLAFPFDGQAAWNHQVRSATLHLVLASGPTPDPAQLIPRAWDLSLAYRLDSFHTNTWRRARTCQEERCDCPK